MPVVTCGRQPRADEHWSSTTSADAALITDTQILVSANNVEDKGSLSLIPCVGLTPSPLDTRPSTESRDGLIAMAKHAFEAQRCQDQL
jgi:hypothetical protein